MKAILTYAEYKNLGNQYQIKFIYENESEIKNTYSWIKKLKDKNLINPYYIKIYNKTCTQKTNIIDGTNIPKEILIPFISMLITLNNITVIINNQEYTSFDLETINETINKLQITTQKRKKRTKI